MVPKAFVRLMFGPMLFGILLIALGLIPGFVQSLTDALRHFPNFSNPPKPAYQAQFDKPTRELWIAIVGLVLIALNLAAYLWNR